LFLCYTFAILALLFAPMDKRTFIRILSASMISHSLIPNRAWPSHDKLENWAGNVQYSTEKLRSADSLEHVRDFVKANRKLKVLGTRHCFNTIADSSNQFLSLKDMDKLISLDRAARSVIVAGRMTYGQLGPYLDHEGFALHNLASLPHISIAGACSTATHGSGAKNGNLSTAVSAIEFVNASGEVVQLSRQKDGEMFLGCVVGLGALGVITKVTLDVRPTYRVQQYVYENLPLSELARHFDEIEAAAYSVSLFSDWQDQRINEVWLKRVVEPGRVFEAPQEFFGAKKAAKNLHPITALSAENCTEQMGIPGPWYDRLPHFRMGFTPSAGKELQSEYFVPRQNAVDAILAVNELRDQLSPYLLISEIRAIAGDNLWLSPCYKQPSVTIHFTWKPDWLSVRKVLPVIEKQLGPYRPRPHWGKLFTISPAQLHASYEKLEDFVRLSEQHDPKGKFRNQFLNTNIFGAA
jgi:xylitol oxidase